MLKKILLSLTILVGSITPMVGIHQMALAAPTASSVALCEGADDGSGTASCNDDTSGETVSKVVKTAIRIFQGIVGILAVFYVIIGGLSFITSGGDASKAKTAREKIIYAVIGLVVVGVAEIIVQFALNRALD